MTNGFDEENNFRQKGLFEDSELNYLVRSGDEDESGRFKRSMKVSQLDRVVRQRKLMLKRFRGIIRIVLVLAIFYFTYRLMVSSRWYLPNDTITSYKIQRIQIVGNRITPTYKIVSAINNIELPHRPIYMIKTDEFAKKIMNLSPVRKVYVKRLWNPARLIIYVEEKEPVITISPSLDVEPIAFFTTDGTLIGQDYLPLPEYYCPIKILTYGNNEDYSKWTKDKIQLINSIAKTLEHLTGERVEYFDMKMPDDVYVKLTSVNLRLGVLDSQTQHRIKDINAILKEAQSLENNVTVKYIDLSWDESKYIKLGESDNVQDSNSSD